MEILHNSYEVLQLGGFAGTNTYWRDMSLWCVGWCDKKKMFVYKKNPNKLKRCHKKEIKCKRDHRHAGAFIFVKNKKEWAKRESKLDKFINDWLAP